MPKNMSYKYQDWRGQNPQILCELKVKLFKKQSTVKYYELAQIMNKANQENSTWEKLMGYFLG